MSDDLSGDMLAPSWPNLVSYGELVTSTNFSNSVILSSYFFVSFMATAILDVASCQVNAKLF